MVFFIGIKARPFHILSLAFVIAITKLLIVHVDGAMKSSKRGDKVEIQLHSDVIS
jgi:hypothetical protein